MPAYTCELSINMKHVEVYTYIHKYVHCAHWKIVVLRWSHLFSWTHLLARQLLQDGGRGRQVLYHQVNGMLCRSLWPVMRPPKRVHEAHVNIVPNWWWWYPPNIKPTMTHCNHEPWWMMNQKNQRIAILQLDPVQNLQSLWKPHWSRHENSWTSKQLQLETWSSWRLSSSSLMGG